MCFQHLIYLYYDEVAIVNNMPALIHNNLLSKLLGLRGQSVPIILSFSNFKIIF